MSEASTEFSVLEPSNPDTLSQAELAQAMGVVLGTSVEAKAIPRAYWPVVLAQMGYTYSRGQVKANQ